MLEVLEQFISNEENLRRRAYISHKENPGKQMTSELMGTRDGPKGGNFNSLSRRRFAVRWWWWWEFKDFYSYNANINSLKALDSYHSDLERLEIWHKLTK